MYKQGLPHPEPSFQQFTSDSVLKILNYDNESTQECIKVVLHNGISLYQCPFTKHFQNQQRLCTECNS